eukprot:TRINITY_DN27349_c0_g1_i1.p1 TRINITY_DN27349_c0_g1~~TRINITY_DN27349_c0_g1_i1.p1  ORF type:complete len:792 (-),score=188.03 TRINITY_DN27349_c0_g1_i1:160-2535(-)
MVAGAWRTTNSTYGSGAWDASFHARPRGSLSHPSLALAGCGAKGLPALGARARRAPLSDALARGDPLMDRWQSGGASASSGSIASCRSSVDLGGVQMPRMRAAAPSWDAFPGLQVPRVRPPLGGKGGVEEDAAYLGDATKELRKRFEVDEDLDSVAVGNLRRRFPAAPLAAVRAALRDQDGHAGRAAAALAERYGAGGGGAARPERSSRDVERDEQVENLCRRFPTASPREVRNALAAHNGHAGRAAAELAKVHAGGVRSAEAPAAPAAIGARGRSEPEVVPPAKVLLPPKYANVRDHRKEAEAKVPMKRLDEPKEVDWSKADPKKWRITTTEFDGSYTLSPLDPPRIVNTAGPVMQGLKKLKTNPVDYQAVFYQSDIASWPGSDQEYNLVERTKGGFNVAEEEDGAFTCMQARYQALKPGVKVQRDKFTDKLVYEERLLGKPLCPGRGEGFADVPCISVVGDVDPYDVAQGAVGDCWLLCALSALAEYPGAIKQLFKNTPDIEDLPKDAPNTYVVTLYDLPTWTPVDIVVDERLCTKADGSGLLGCAPSLTGDLWAPYVEKAVAIHCGGWDKIVGGQCTHAWRLLTGCKDQYTFKEKEEGDGFGCYGSVNPKTRTLAELANSPHDGCQTSWPTAWPKVGGGGRPGVRLDYEAMFERMCAWHDANYMMACGSKEGSDKDTTDGIADSHAYTILDVVNDAAGTKFDLIKVRNPWGNGEFNEGKWDDDGPNWKRYPKVREALKPTLGVDDGVFWVEKDEFFKYFKVIYLCALDMSQFVEDETETPTRLPAKRS